MSLFWTLQLFNFKSDADPDPPFDFNFNADLDPVFTLKDPYPAFNSDADVNLASQIRNTAYMDLMSLPPRSFRSSGVVRAFDC